MELDLSGIFEQNSTFDYGDYENKEDSTSGGFMAVFIPILYAFVVVLGLLGNGLVLVVLWQKKRSPSVMDIFIFNLSIADVLLLLTVPLWAVEAVNAWIFGTRLCKLCGVLFHINFYCGIFLMACISLNGYLSIIHGMKMYSCKKPLATWLTCTTVWFLSLLLSIPDWLYLKSSLGGKIECTHWYTSEKARLVSRLLHHVVGFLLPVMLLLYCLMGIVHRCCQGLQKLQAPWIILALVVVFFVSWTPYNIILLVDTIQAVPTDSTELSDKYRQSRWTAVNVAAVFGFLHCCLNPFIYFLLSRKFRSWVLILLRCGGCSLTDTYLWDLEQVDRRAPASPEEKGSLNPMGVLRQTTES
ncbi:hypothetical protein NFI96_024150 [Prochilodus magdalenae]|nr:hypothetical protein NFI96_024150 [Prochilodus magdalenae]